MNFRTIIKEYAETPISRHLILELLSEYKSPNHKISELLKSKELISIRRGLYITGPKMDLPSPEPFLIANHLRGPSYVSCGTTSNQGLQRCCKVLVFYLPTICPQITI
jgi:hypothetical protein